ncbi:MAG: hypothetical protein HC810_04845 [Acaryochloridaceae cyanobacterium RL_2_7]|nr:hypothetical protein [Acaryochloridaceae cyanobacterium RL_2_7]
MIHVKDNGEGIAPEQIDQIFRHGYTTRKEGHGFGLHASALDAKQLGGHLAAASAGKHCGAQFTLVLPAIRQVMEG